MKKTLWALAAVTFLVLTMGTTARADSFTFNVDFCSSPCLNGGTGGTVTLTQINSTTVEVDVSLANGLVFHDAGLDSFAFNITSNPGVSFSLVNGGGGTWAFEQPSTSTDGASPGNSQFGYAVNCSAQGGNCTGSPSILDFRLSFASGLSVSSLETLSGSSGTTAVDFAANVSNGTCTGMIGAGNGTGQSTANVANPGGTCGSPATPEPGALTLLGTGLIAIAGFGTRKLLR